MAQPKPIRVRCEIVNRVKTVGLRNPSNGSTPSIVSRKLSCGHRHPEPAGGKAKFATEAYCKTCSDSEVQKVAAE